MMYVEVVIEVEVEVEDANQLRARTKRMMPPRPRPAYESASGHVEGDKEGEESRVQSDSGSDGSEYHESS